jgi:hypothetical protein
MRGRPTFRIRNEQSLHRSRHRSPLRPGTGQAPPGHVHRHLAPQPPGQEVIDNSVDEALAGHAQPSKSSARGRLSCGDRRRPRHAGGHPPRGRHPRRRADPDPPACGRQVLQQELQFSGGLHGVGVSVVNALSSKVEVSIRRDGNEYPSHGFQDGDRHQPLEVIGTVGKKNTGTTVRFWPDPKYFDTEVLLPKLKHVLRAKAVLCPGLNVACRTRPAATRHRVALRRRPARLPAFHARRCERLPVELFIGTAARSVAASTGPAWLPEGELTGAGKLRQPDSHGAGRHPRQRPAYRPHRCPARVLRFPQPAAAWREAGTGRRLGPLVFRAVSCACRIRSSGADQGTPVFAPGRGLRRRRSARWRSRFG